MSHTSKFPPLKYTTATLPTDLPVGTIALDTTTNEHKSFNGSSWDIIQGGEEIGTPTIVFDSTGPAYDQIQGDIPVNWKAFDTSLKGLVIGTSCENIEYSSFRACTGMVGSLAIPDSVTGIGDVAFKDAGFDGSLSLSNNITNIGNQTFRDCSFTGSLNIPDSVEVIQSYCFRDTSFNNINIGSGFGGVSAPSQSFLYGSESVTGISVDNQNPYLKTDANNSLLFNSDRTQLYLFAKSTPYGDVVIPNSVDTVFETFNIFRGSTSITSIVFSPNMIGTLPNFYDCTNLAGTITIPNGIDQIRSFYNTQISGTVSIPPFVTYIDYAAFKNCSNIERFEIQATTAPSYIGGEAFLNTSPTDGKIHVPVGAVGYASSYNGLTVVYDL